MWIELVFGGLLCLYRAFTPIVGTCNRLRITTCWFSIIIVWNISACFHCEMPTKLHRAFFDWSSRLKSHLFFCVQEIFAWLCIASLKTLECEWIFGTWVWGACSGSLEHKRVIFKECNFFFGLPYLSIFIDFIPENLTPICSFCCIFHEHSFKKFNHQWWYLWLFWKL